MNKIEQFPNGVVVKTHNKKVCVLDSKHNEDAVHLQFMIVTDSLEPRAAHCVLRDKVVVTGISISKEGAVSLYAALSEYLQMKGMGYTTDLKK